MKVVIQRAVEADVPVLLWGAPGTGKTAAVRALAREAGAHLVVLCAESAQDADITGIRVPDGRRARWLAPDWAIEVREALDRGQPAWLFLDEITCFPRAAEAALLGLVQSRQIAGLDLRGCRIVAAANPPDQAADGRDLSPAAANRWRHVEWRLDPAVWAAGARAGWGEPQSPALAAARSLIASYVLTTTQSGERGDVPPLLVVPRDLAAAGSAWPSPRSWDAAARLLALAGDVRAPGAADDVAGCVGSAAAERMLAWVVERDLPDPEALLADPSRVALPDRIDRLATALEAACSAACADHPSRAARWNAAWTLLARAPRDVAVPAAGILCRARAAHAELRHAKLPTIAIELDAVLRAASEASS
jgi:MoxR-like ATPase